MIRTQRAAAVAVLAAASAVLPTAVATAAPLGDPPPGGIVVVPGDPQGQYEPPSVDVGVTTPGRPGSHAPRRQPAAAHGQGGTACTFEPAPDWAGFIRGVPGSQPNPGQPGIGGSDQIDPKARLYARVCKGVMDFVWLGPGENPNAAAPVRPPTPGELARRAAAQLVLPLPVPRHSPDLRLGNGTSAVVTGEHTWIWVDPARWTPRRKRVQVGAVWAEVAATPVRLAFTPGDGHPAVACAGPGTPYTSAAGLHAASPTCDYVYPRSSAGMAGGVVRARYAISWRVTWQGAIGAAPANGALPEMTSQATATFAVAEAQGLIIR